FVSFEEQLNTTVAVLRGVAEQAPQIEQIAALVCERLLLGHTLLTCGNGGSAADAQHLAEELTGRYRANRRPFPAICLAADTTAITCIANDFGYEQVFARQVEAYGRPGDVLVCFTTSGNSPNILAALETARSRGLVTIALLGKGGGKAQHHADHKIVVASDDSARVQEAHMQIVHFICEVVERAVVKV
ncbi:MAG TPA: SIS domain-containing protein, partial [Roseiflexaceae bacterium]|nr:SIS domain-containing protein [Roseiflexaceae bacterium]